MKPETNYSNQRVGIFVDVQNLYHSAKNLYHGRVNYTELKKYLLGERHNNMIVGLCDSGAVAGKKLLTLFIGFDNTLINIRGVFFQPG